MKKILMVSCYSLGNAGVQNVMMSIVRLFPDVNFDFLVYSLENDYYKKEIEERGGKIFVLPLKRFHNRFLEKVYYYIRGKKIRDFTRDICLKNGYDVIHCNADFDTAYFLQGAKDAGIPIRISHMHIYTDIAKMKFKKFHKHLKKSVLTNSTVRIACSIKSGNSFFGNDNYIFVPNFVDYDRFIDASLHAERADNSFIHIGRFDENKNQMFLLNIFLQLIHLNSDRYLHLVGFGDRRKLEEFIVRNQLENKVIFHDSRSDVAKLLAESKCMIFPSKEEGFGIALIEAQVSGVMCYASDSIPTETNIGLCKYLSLNNTPKEWADFIENDLKNLENVKTVDDKYDIKKLRRTYERIYKI